MQTQWPQAAKGTMKVSTTEPVGQDDSVWSSTSKVREKVLK